MGNCPIGCGKGKGDPESNRRQDGYKKKKSHPEGTKGTEGMTKGGGGVASDCQGAVPFHKRKSRKDAYDVL